MTPVLVLVCSGFFHFTFASNRLRYFNFRDGEYNKKEILDQCKKNNESLVTLYDEEDAEVTYTLTDKTKAWLGLYRSEKSQPTWSNSYPITFNKSSVNVSDGEQRCEAIDNNTWTGFKCSERKPFMCYKGNNYTLVNMRRNWCQALQHCRRYFTDLVSISNDTENREVIKKGKGTSFWIGLMHDTWEWQDKSCSTFREWKYLKNDDGGCTMCRHGLMEQYGCGNYAAFFCSKGDVRIKVIDKNLTWEEAFYYCEEHHTRLLWIKDGKDQEAVSQWLNHTDFRGPFWIGLRQSLVFGFWFWTSDLPVIYDNWRNGVPEMPLSNHCGVINKMDKKWSDENCLVPLRFLCEEETFIRNRKLTVSNLC